MRQMIDHLIGGEVRPQGVDADDVALSAVVAPKGVGPGQARRPHPCADLEDIERTVGLGTLCERLHRCNHEDVTDGNPLDPPHLQERELAGKGNLKEFGQGGHAR